MYIYIYITEHYIVIEEIVAWSMWQHVYSKHRGTSGRTLEASSSDVGGANPGALDSILGVSRFTVIFRCLKFSDERLGTTKYCTDCTATCKLTCTVFCLFVPIPQTVNIFAKFRESTDRHVLSKLILWNYAPDMLKSTQACVCSRCLQKGLCSLKHTY